MNQEAWNGLATALVTALVVWLTRFIDKRREKMEAVKLAQQRASKTGVEANSLTDMRVKHVENRIYKSTRFMRGFVFHFHNGEFTDAGLSLIKLTIRHEVLEGHFVKPITEHYQGKPVPEMFYSMIRRVIAEGHYWLEDREQVAVADKLGYNLPLYEWMISYDVKSMLCVGLRDSKTKKIVAVLVLHFPNARALNSNDIINIKEEKKSIEDIYDQL